MGGGEGGGGVGGAEKICDRVQSDSVGLTRVHSVLLGLLLLLYRVEMVSYWVILVLWLQTYTHTSGHFSYIEIISDLIN